MLRKTGNLGHKAKSPPPPKRKHTGRNKSECTSKASTTFNRIVGDWDHLQPKYFITVKHNQTSQSSRFPSTRPAQPITNPIVLTPSTITEKTDPGQDSSPRPSGSTQAKANPSVPAIACSSLYFSRWVVLYSGRSNRLKQVWATGKKDSPPRDG